MSSPLPSEALTLPAPRLGIKNALFKLLKKLFKLDKEYLIMGQQQSPLMRLPPEIRTIIWQYVLGGKRTTLRLVRYRRTRRSAHCNLHTECGYRCGWRAIFFQMDDGSRGDDRWIPYPPHVTSLLKTCRLILWEAIDALYGCNVFVFYPREFWAAYKQMMPHNFARVRVMDFSRTFFRDDKELWARLCKIVAGMTNLRDLWMRLYDTSKTYEDIRGKHRRDELPRSTQKIIYGPKYTGPISEKFILDSLYQIKQVRKFTVEFDEREKGQAMPEVRSDSPFTLICEYAEERNARLEKSWQEERERQRITQEKDRIWRLKEAGLPMV